MEALWQDLRYAVRMLRKSPGFTAVAVLTLALGIGANTAIFSVINGWLLRPLAVKDPGQLEVLATQQAGSANLSGFSYPDLLDYREQADAFSDMLAYQFGQVGLTANGATNPLFLNYVTGNFFTMLGVEPELGGLILPTEKETAGPDPVILLGYSYWRRRFGGDPSVIGKTVLVDGHPVTVIGVAPRNFYGLHAFLEMDAYMPLGVVAVKPGGNRLWADRAERSLRVLGRLKPGVSLKRAQASLDLVAGRLQKQYPDSEHGLTVRAFPEWLARPEPSAASSVAVIAALFVFLAASLILLASFNVASILLARATAREREMAIRAALGAGRRRLIFQLLTESVLLAILGGIGGIMIGNWAGSLLSAVPFGLDIPVHLEFSFDWRVFAYALAVTLVTSLVAGALPAVRGSRVNLDTMLRECGRGLAAGPSRQWARSALLVAQVTGSAILLIVAGLFVHSLQKAQHLDLGFDPDRVLNVSLDPGQVGYDETYGKEFYRRLLDRVRAVPGVESVSLAFSVPFGFRNRSAKIHVEGRGLFPSEPAPEIFFNLVSTEYFATMRIPILRGRAFSEGDNQTAPNVAIVNDSMARLSWPNQNPIGKTFGMESPSGPKIQVIGVAKDGKYLTPGDRGVPYFYLPLAQSYISARTLQIRSSQMPETLISELQRQITALEPSLPVFEVRTMKQLLAGANGLLPVRLAAGFAAALGTLGLALTMAGLYGVVSHAVSQRSHEIAIRTALGAQEGDILKMVLGQGLRLVVLGLIAGVFGGLAAARGISTLLFGVSPADPATLAGVPLLLIAVFLVACYIPARRATKLDPALALRDE